jgi:hypothetical protein
MDSNTIISVIFILIIITFYVLIIRNKRKKEKKYLQPLFKLAGKVNCTISQYEIWSNSIIGIDNLNNQIFVIGNINDVATFHCIKLTEFQICKLNEVSRTVNIASRTLAIKGIGVKVIDKIELVFVYLAKNKPDFIVEIYNNETGNFDLTGELQIAEKWCKIANDKIESSK